MTANKPQPIIQPKTVVEWLAYIEALHPKAIAMGLDRVKSVIDKLQINPTFPIITVAGTNGKGSVCAMLSHIYTQAGYRVGCYTSPHINHYSERVTVNLQPIADDDLCAAFAAVEAARGSVALTYFEMGTLAAMRHFCRQQLDVCILEIGLGGRLDAVNAFEPNCAIVTTIALDHMEFLGDTREKIGYEKAGVFRTDKLAVCGDENPPDSLVEYAKKIGANLQLIQRDFQVKKTNDGWQYSDEKNHLDLPKLGLIGDFQLNNAACVVRTLLHLSDILPIAISEHSNAGLQDNIRKALSTVHLMGRFQQLRSNPQVIVDVAHNPHAAKSLAQNLKSIPCEGKTLAVFGMLADKDIAGTMEAVQAEIDVWYLADIQSLRGSKAHEIQQILHKVLFKAECKTPSYLFENVTAALAAAYIDADKNDRIIVFGSFYTVADALAAS
ncbi:MAG TPA: bifunctional tetrahydrofolate synthase/dihydrofolate synthase [Methylotenera sp.]|nr:bifunctional tetrahydrofolate synthase/dihydrofolate synthase [Methylotenera sp.]